VSFQATRFILGLTDLNSSQKAVAHTLAYHANKDGGNSYPSMETIARESGLQSRRSAQRIVRQLEKKRIIVATTPKTGGRGQDKATVYRLDLDYESPINSDTTVALSGQQTATPTSPFTDDKQRPVGHESATPETIKRDIQGPKQRHHGHTNSNEESLRVSEEVEPTSSRVKKPHTPISNSNAHSPDEEGESKPEDQQQTNPVSSSSPRVDFREECAARAVDRLQAEILRIPLSKGRRFQCNGKVKEIIGEELGKGRSQAMILEAAEYIGRTLTDRDQMPGLTLADNLAATIVAIEIGQEEATEEQKQQERQAMDKKRENRRYELMKTAVIEQEKKLGREYGSWTGPSADFTPSDPRAFKRYELAVSLEDETNDGRLMIDGKRLGDLRREAGELPPILAIVAGQLAAEGF
jgi:hypothetical protein